MTSLNPVLTVGRQVAEPMRRHLGLSKAAAAAEAAALLTRVGIPNARERLSDHPHQFSGGQRQRIMIAMALVLEPELLIADEPTTALDVTTQQQILSLIAELQEKHGTAVLFITHDMGVVAEIADTVYVMKSGDLVEHAPIETLLRTPKQDYTQKLLRAVPSLIPRAARVAPGGDPVLKVDNLDMIYGGGGFFVKRPGTHAAKDVTFTVARGRTLGIVGESGSGKSTVARCIMRLIAPTAGSIRLRDTDIAHLNRAQLKPHRQHLQVVFQDPFRSLNPRWTVGRSLIEGPVNYGTSPRDAMARAAELMEIVGLPRDSLDRYPHQFSGGQRQRIAIARALITEPRPVVLDEAVSALDVSIRAQILDLLA
ncbi:MAG TPA: ABC transporter ATP-binding protein, partial [Paracoccaceae bacterium]|nr:ABC transporter ATP-binding protein [Paracoccaceae bacterium]